MYEIVVFAGPTIAANDPGLLDSGVIVRGPAAQGDIFQAAQHRPFAIVLIDGYFNFVPAPWHRELLWAMSAGIHVFGASSIGALRAAELGCLGMIGVGEVYQMFTDGTLTDDDEVAVVHGPAELGYPLLSIAMVDIRATLAKASKVIPEEVADRIAVVAKGLNFRERNLRAICVAAEEAGVPASELSHLEAWWPDNFVDRKKQDAIAAVRAAQVLRRTNPGKFNAEFLFEVTDPWLQFTESQKDQVGSISNPLRL